MRRSMAGRVARWTALALLAGASTLAAAPPIEPPALLDAVAQGKLPPVAQRLPRQPAVGIAGLSDLQPGRHGGSLRMLISGAKDTRLMVVYSYARLVAFTPGYELVPDILESVENDNNRVFTLKLRAGHRWSDGHPFTAEDFRYYWEEVARNPMLSPTGVPNDLQVEGEMPRFEVIDETTVRYRWTKPNPYFLPGLAGSRPLDIFKPAHYLRQFHERYAKPEELARRIKDTRQRNWAALHNRVDNSYRNDNPDLPTLQPWQLVTKAPSERFVFKRNPYYHRVDQEGRQLPYIDEVVMFVADSKIIAAKTGAGEVDLQARYLRFDNYTFLKEGEKRNHYAVRLWRTGKGAQVALFPNMNCNDPVWRGLLRDVRVRRALSLAINRHEINQIIYYGLATPSNNTVLPQSVLFDKAFQQRWTAFDVRLANKLLDEVGLTKRDSEGFRVLPDGRRAQIVVETVTESSEQVDALELMRDSWRKIGIKLFIKPTQRDNFRNRVFSGETVMSMWSGFDNALPTPDTSPDEFAPIDQQLQWPKWGQHYQTRGTAGEAPELPEVRELLDLHKAWRWAESREEKVRIWRRILELHADNVFTIGLVTGVFQPVIVSDRLRNVPKEGVYNYEPGAFFGVYRPEFFWFAGPDGQAALGPTRG